MRPALIGEIEVLGAFDDQAFVLLLECLFEELKYFCAFLWKMDDFMLNCSEDLKLGNEFASFKQLCLQQVFPVLLQDIEDVDQKCGFFVGIFSLRFILSQSSVFEEFSDGQRRLCLLINGHDFSV